MKLLNLKNRTMNQKMPHAVGRIFTNRVWVNLTPTVHVVVDHGLMTSVASSVIKTLINQHLKEKL